MSFSGSQSEPIKNGERQLDRIKTHLGRNPKVCSVCTITCSQRNTARSAMWLAARCDSRLQPARPRGTLVNTSVYLKPAKLLNVALDMLARLAPCLNLRVGELGHKDLLDTIGANNCRK